MKFFLKLMPIFREGFKDTLSGKLCDVVFSKFQKFQLFGDTFFFFLNVRFVQPFGYGQPNRHITCVLKFEKGKQFLSPSKT